jgi:hydroxymethylglutaryl-CoA reductase (NADPH)
VDERAGCELSLGSAIVAEEWVQAHDLLGRNRP